MPYAFDTRGILLSTSEIEASARAEAIADVMLEKFGTRALEIAETQLRSACEGQPAVAKAWGRIVSILAKKMSDGGARAPSKA